MSRRRSGLLALAAPVLGVALVAGCSSRQAEADARAEEGVAQVVALLERVPRQQWARPSAAVREQLAANAVSYRVLELEADGTVDLAVWRVDTGADPFTDDTVRTGVACAQVEPDGVSRATACPPRLAPEAPATSVDWSDASAAHDAALVDISGALDRTQEEVRRGRVVDRRQAEAELTRRGLVVRVLPSDDPTTLRATVQRTARSERMGDTSRSVSATSCTTVTVSVDPAAPYYSSVDGRACSPR
ncbi:hypothetical protein GCM10009633_04910 [Janibacter melonis]|uniref:hypothetical protein n=1 Tax=Janibacter melonis TaxID=262209 RepID=UPI001E39AF1E|nr:hypothetical protein [Janibacter melonis]MCB5992299.1 hypothetical protein [Janibacter melonis]